MAMPMLLLLSALLLTPSHLPAQWRLAVATGPATTSGHSRDDLDSEHAEILPDHPATWSVGISRERGAWRLRLDGSWISSDLAIRGSTTSLVTHDALSAWGLGIEGSRRLLGPAASTSLWGGIGVIGERWSFATAGGDSRWRAALRGSLQLDVPFSSSWAALVRGEASVGSSLFSADELPEGYSRHKALRAGLLLGVSRQW
jgi:hypothetical protein